jgi:hypothetical protein
VSGRELDADEATKSVLDTLVDARLLTVDADGVEIAHGSLIRHWPRLRGWLAEDRDGLRIQRALTRATDDWESLDRDPGALYRGRRLAVATEWTGRSGDAVTARGPSSTPAGPPIAATSFDHARSAPCWPCCC